MNKTVAHFEIYGDNPEKLAEFYKGLFGWKIEKVPNPGMDYWMIGTVPTDGKGMPTAPGGINGGLMKRPTPEARAWLNYVTVPSVDEAAAQVRKMGGTVMRPKTAVPKMGWFVVAMDPEQNAFGIWQDDSNAA